MSQWFRMYAEVLNDPKAQRLSGDDFKGWINILCLASQADGCIPSDEDIGFALRIDRRKAQKLVASLISAGLIDVTETGRTPHNWNGRQYKSDVSTERVKRFRKRSKPVSETPIETPPDTETEQSIPLSNDNGSAEPPTNPEKQFWDNAVTYLGKAKRSLVGKWVSAHGRDATAQAITAAQMARAVDPIPYIEKTLRGQSTGAFEYVGGPC